MRKLEDFAKSGKTLNKQEQKAIRGGDDGWQWMFLTPPWQWFYLNTQGVG